MRSTVHFFKSGWILGLILFGAAVLIRLIPELKAGPWPIGYDTFNTYAPDLANFKGQWLDWLLTANVLYFVFLPFKLIGLSAFVTIKVVAPLLYGGLILSFYLFLKKTDKVSPLVAFLAGALLLVQLASLRLSWDLLRNELALIFFFLGLINLPKINQTKNLIYFCFFTALVVFSNQLVTAILGVILAVYFLAKLFKKNWAFLGRLILPIVLLLSCFVLVLSTPGKVLFDNNIIFTTESNYFNFYFYEYRKIFSYSELSAIIRELFMLYYIFLLPFVPIGFWIHRKNLILTTLTIWLLLGTFSSLLFSGIGLIVWDRWLVMLVLPFTFYAAAGLVWLGQITGSPWQWAKRAKIISYPLSVAILAAIFMASIVRVTPFLTATYPEAKPPFANDTLNAYFPRTMVHNAVGIWKVEETIDCIKWLNLHAPTGSVVIVDNRYRGLVVTNFDLKDRYIITNSWSQELNQASLELAGERGYWPIYLIWNTSNPVDGFDRIYNSRDSAVYVAM